MDTRYNLARANHYICMESFWDCHDALRPLINEAYFTKLKPGWHDAPSDSGCAGVNFKGAFKG